MTTEPRELLGLHVEVYDAVTGEHLMGKGRVIAYTDQPTITVEAEDGTRSHHVVSLPRIEYRPVRVGRFPRPAHVELLDRIDLGSPRD